MKPARGRAGFRRSCPRGCRPGATIAAVAAPDRRETTLTVELVGLGAATSATAPGEPAVVSPVRVPDDGRYMVRVTGDMAGTFRLFTSKNAAVEAIDTDDGNPLAIDDSWTSLGSGRYGVITLPLVDSIELIQNGGFETGDFTGWDATSNGTSESTPWTVGPAGGGFFFDSSPLDGNFSAYNGFDGEAGLQYGLSQRVTIPANARHATLTANYRIKSGAGDADAEDRVFRIDVLGAGVEEPLVSHRENVTVNGPEVDRGWNSRSFDLSAHAGKTVVVRFTESVPETHTGPALLELDDISLIAASQAKAQSDVDRYTVDLTGKVGHPIDIVLAGQATADFSAELLQLIAPDGSTVLATAVADPAGVEAANHDLAILDFIVPADGVYTLRLDSSAIGEYAIGITDSLVFDTEPNDDPAIDQLRSLNDTQQALGYVDDADPDWYLIDLTAGLPVDFITETPAYDPAGSPLSDLAPALRILSPTGAVVAQDAASAPDGRNAMARLVPSVTGTYSVRVSAESGHGEYLLKVRSATGVVDRHVFYNRSGFDGDDPAANQQDDLAIAPDTRALMPGGTASFENYTGYARGINGIMVDVAGLTGEPTVDDFQFHVGNDNDPSGWIEPAVAPEISVRPGDGTDQSDRITLIWPDNEIQKQWLMVTVLATETTRLAANDVFFFGNAVGESGNSTSDAKVNAFDMLATRDNQRTFLDPAPIDFAYDFDRNARVNATDMLIARNNTTHFLTALKLIAVPAKHAHDAALQQMAWIHQLQFQYAAEDDSDDQPKDLFRLATAATR